MVQILFCTFDNCPKIVQVSNVKRFAHIGLIYALGDIFEMESVNYIDSSTYTVLSQSKLIITATMIWLLEGKAQSMMQWFILFTTSSGMLEYVLVGKAKGGSKILAKTSLKINILNPKMEVWFR